MTKTEIDNFVTRKIRALQLHEGKVFTELIARVKENAKLVVVVPEPKPEPDPINTPTLEPKQENQDELKKATDDKGGKK